MRRLGQIGRANPSGSPIQSPLYIATGTAVDLSVATNPAYGTNAAGDLFVMQVGIRHSGTYTPPIAPGGWVQVAGPNDQSNTAQYIYTRTARSTGGETGTKSITAISTPGGQAVIHTFRAVATSSFTEGIVSTGSAINSTSISAPSVTTLGPARLAVAFVVLGDDLGTIVSFTGESGGDWVSRFSRQATVGVDSGLDLQSAQMASTGTITGGSYTPGSGYNDINNVIGLAFVGV